MNSVISNISDQSFKCIICQGDEGNTSGQFPGRLRVKPSCQNACHMHLDCLATDQARSKLDQRGCSQCQQQLVLPLICLSGPMPGKSVPVYALCSKDMQAFEQNLAISRAHNVSKHEYDRQLFFALEAGNGPAVEELWHAGANINATNENGQTPLHIAALRGDMYFLDLLIDYRANLDAVNEDKLTPLHLATYAGNINCMKRLIQKGANVNAVDHKGHTPLHYTVLGGKIDCLKELLRKEGVEVNAKNNRGETLLHIAVNLGMIDCLKELLRKEGVQVNATNKLGETPLHCAVNQGKIDILKLLLTHEAVDVNATDMSGSTPLHTLCGSTSLDPIYKKKVLLLESLTVLLNHKAVDVNITNLCGETPLDLAYRGSYDECAKLLLAKEQEQEQQQCRLM